MRTTTTYELELRETEDRLARLERGFQRRLRTWIDEERSRHRDGNSSPSLELFIDHAVLVDGGIGQDSHDHGFLLGKIRPRIMAIEEESDPYGQIGIFSAYGRVPAPGCFFTFDWHCEMFERPEELEAIADDVYFAIRQLAPAMVEAALEVRVEVALLRSHDRVSRASNG